MRRSTFERRVREQLMRYAIPAQNQSSGHVDYSYPSHSDMSIHTAIGMLFERIGRLECPKHEYPKSDRCVHCGAPRKGEK